MVVLLLAVLVGTGCLSSQMRRVLDAKGEIVKQYDEGEQTLYVVREGKRFVKYRVYTWSVGSSIGVSSEPLYAVDTQIRECFAGGELAASVSCESIRRDPDLGEYITW